MSALWTLATNYLITDYLLFTRYTSDVGAVDTLLAPETDNVCQMSAMSLCLLGMIMYQAGSK